jgi:hypothetical protein
MLPVLGILAVLGPLPAVAGVESPVTGALTLLFLLAGPALAAWPLLSGLPRAARAVVAGAVSLVTVVLVAQLMLFLGLWSPRGGVAAVAVCCLLPGVAGAVTGRWSSRGSPDRPG